MAISELGFDSHETPRNLLGAFAELLKQSKAWMIMCREPPNLFKRSSLLQDYWEHRIEERPNQADRLAPVHSICTAIFSKVGWNAISVLSSALSTLLLLSNIPRPVFSFGACVQAEYPGVQEIVAPANLAANIVACLISSRPKLPNSLNKDVSLTTFLGELSICLFVRVVSKPLDNSESFTNGIRTIDLPHFSLLISVIVFLNN